MDTEYYEYNRLSIICLSVNVCECTLIHMHARTRFDEFSTALSWDFFLPFFSFDHLTNP